MPTSSIMKNFVIKDDAGAQRFLEIIQEVPEKDTNTLDSDAYEKGIQSLKRLFETKQTNDMTDSKIRK